MAIFLGKLSKLGIFLFGQLGLVRCELLSSIRDQLGKFLGVRWRQLPMHLEELKNVRPNVMLHRCFSIVYLLFVMQHYRLDLLNVHSLVWIELVPL